MERKVNILEPLQLNKVKNREVSPLARGKSPAMRVVQVTPLQQQQLGSYLMEKCLGAGAYGEVYMATNLKTGEKAAVKKMEKAPEIYPEVVRETDIIYNIGTHPFCVKFVEKLETKSHVFLVMSFAAGGDLYEFVFPEVPEDAKGESLPRSLDEPKSLQLFCKILLGLEHLHKKNIVHGDIKLENVFLDSHGEPLLGDFGLARYFESGTKTYFAQGTLHYCAPESILQKDIEGPEVDIWSMGIMLYIMLFGRYPFYGATEVDVLRAIAYGPLRLNFKGAGPETCDLLRRLLHKEPSKRATTEQIKKHPAVEEIFASLEKEFQTNPDYVIKEPVSDFANDITTARREATPTRGMGEGRRGRDPTPKVQLAVAPTSSLAGERKGRSKKSKSPRDKRKTRSKSRSKSRSRSRSRSRKGRSLSVSKSKLERSPKDEKGDKPKEEKAVSISEPKDDKGSEEKVVSINEDLNEKMIVSLGRRGSSEDKDKTVFKKSPRKASKSPRQIFRRKRASSMDGHSSIVRDHQPPPTSSNVTRDDSGEATSSSAFPGIPVHTATDKMRFLESAGSNSQRKMASSLDRTAFSSITQGETKQEEVKQEETKQPANSKLRRVKSPDFVPKLNMEKLVVEAQALHTSRVTDLTSRGIPDSPFLPTPKSRKIDLEVLLQAQDLVRAPIASLAPPKDFVTAAPAPAPALAPPADATSPAPDSLRQPSASQLLATPPPSPHAETTEGSP